MWIEFGFIAGVVSKGWVTTTGGGGVVPLMGGGNATPGQGYPQATSYPNLLSWGYKNSCFLFLCVCDVHK